LAASGYFIDVATGTWRPCPAHSSCPGDMILPIPDSGYWVDRSDIKYASYIYPCEFSTCKGAVNAILTSSARRRLSISTLNTTWWDSTAYYTTYLERLIRS
jgi:hypothetical protein